MATRDARIVQLQTAMAGADVDALVLRLPENVLLATNYWVQITGFGLAFVPREGAATLIVSEFETDEAAQRWGGDVRPFPAFRLTGTQAGAAIEAILRDLAREHGVAGGRIGWEGSFEAIAPSHFAGEPGAVGLPTRNLIASTCASEQLVDATALLERVRTIKLPEDVEAIRRTNEIACIGLDAFKAHARPGISEAEVAGQIELAIQREGHGYKGVRATRGFATVVSGPGEARGWQYFRSSDRIIEPGDLVMVEMGVVADGYWSDHTRTVIAGGTPSERQREAFAAALAARDAAFAACVPGALAGDVDAAARRACEAAGFEQFPHHTGHGVGFRYHEWTPTIAPGADARIEAGMVLVTEPGIYVEGLGGFRWEDGAVVTEHGAELLAESEYGLD